MFSRYRSSIGLLRVAGEPASTDHAVTIPERCATIVSNANHLGPPIIQRTQIPVTAPHLELTARLRLSVTRLARRLRQETAHGLTPSQGSALASLERHGSLTPSELAEIERIQRPTATRILGALVEAGLVSRQPDGSDRRSARVAITPAGSEILRRGRIRKNAYLARRLERLDPQDLQTLERAAVLIERLLEDER